MVYPRDHRKTTDGNSRFEQALARSGSLFRKKASISISAIRFLVKPYSSATAFLVAPAANFSTMARSRSLKSATVSLSIFA